jgi:hypothetical protein
MLRLGVVEVKKYRYKDVNLTKEAEVVLNEIKKMLAMDYSNSEVVQTALVLMYKVLKKYKYKYVTDVLSHEV